MAITNYIIASPFAITGVYVVGANAILNNEGLHGGQNVIDGASLAIFGMAGAAALISLAIGFIGKRSILTALVALIALAAMMFSSLDYSIARFAGVVGNTVSQADAHNARIDSTEAAIVAKMAEIAQERKDGGCGKQCRILKGELKGLKAELSNLGACQIGDPSAHALAIALGIDPKRYRASMPILNALGLELGGNVLLAAAGFCGAPGARRKPRRDDGNGPMIDITPRTGSVDGDRMLASLRIEGHARSVSELSKRLGVSIGKTHNLIAKLSNDGFVSRQRNGRAMMIMAT